MEAIFGLVRRTVATYIAPYSKELKNSWLGLAITSFSILSSGLTIASYGRHYVQSSIVPTVNGKMGWMLMEIVSPVTVLLFFSTYQQSGPSVSTGRVLLALWLAHYSNRAVISPLMAPGMSNSRVDIVFYSALFNFVNAAWIGHDLGFLNSQEFTLTPRTQLALGLFAMGLLINLSSDYYLQSVRREKGNRSQYILPEWGLYKYILSPNYAGEIVEWIGYAMLLREDSGWFFLAWTICNLAPRARSHLAWYKEKFGAKVGSRRALIPYVY
jgi:3-oxo-5-alpha-steroid 4-dehydrogenase 1